MGIIQSSKILPSLLSIDFRASSSTSSFILSYS